MTKNQNRDDLFSYVKKLYDAGYGFHTLKFPDGTILKGIWDMSKYLSYYEIPENLTGKTVLEIGPANGYFSFEFARRGAKVVAIDRHDEKGFREISQLMSADIKFIIKDINTLDESFGKFDLVFCSHVLQHISDMFANIERIRKITKNMAILCIALADEPQFTEIPMARFIGKLTIDKKGTTRNTFWHPNMACFKQMAESAGFSKVREISAFTQETEDNKGKQQSGVIHCYV